MRVKLAQRADERRGIAGKCHGAQVALGFVPLPVLCAREQREQDESRP